MLFIDEQFAKSASFADSRRECEEIMEEIRKENPSFWPYGLDIHGHVASHGSVYMIREASTRKAVGFTGWQEFQERNPSSGKMEKVGYYSIGILPKYRAQGLAKEAVSRLLQEKQGSVDRVQAFIVKHNSPSLQLAAALGVPVVH